MGVRMSDQVRKFEVTGEDRGETACQHIPMQCDTHMGTCLEVAGLYSVSERTVGHLNCLQQSVCVCWWGVCSGCASVWVCGFGCGCLENVCLYLSVRAHASIYT